MVSQATLATGQQKDIKGFQVQIIMQAVFACITSIMGMVTCRLISCLTIASNIKILKIPVASATGILIFLQKGGFSRLNKIME